MSITNGQVVRIAQPEAELLPELPESFARRTFSIARGKADTFNIITQQEQVAPERLSELLRQAQQLPFEHSFEKVCELRTAKAAGSKEAAAELNRLKHTAWFVCASFNSNRRSRTSILECTAFVGDADQPGTNRATLLAALDALNCCYIVATSTSHGCEGQERYRVVIHLSTPISPDEYAELWKHINDRLGGTLDPGAKDPTRLSYMPRKPIDAPGHDVICVSDRPWFDPSGIAPTAGQLVLQAEVRSTISAEQEEDLRSALQHPPMLEKMADNEFWSNHIGYALLSLGDKGREIFEWISEQAPKYEPGAPEAWWEDHKHYTPQMDYRHVWKLAAKCTPAWVNLERERRVLKAFLPTPTLPQQLSLQTGATGKPLSNVRNAAIVLSRQTTVLLTFDEFLDRVLVRWPSESLRPLEDADVTRVQIELQALGMTSMSVTAARDAVYLAARRNPSNVVTTWLDQLKWDGVRRLSLLIQRGFGATANRYHVRAGRNMLIAMVARAYRPGCQVDEALVFEGPQGAFKSSALRIIGGEYFKELTADPNSKDFEHQLRGVWLGEFPELHAMRRTDDIARIKQFITNREDHYRPPYAREMRDYPRRIVLCGSTNEDCWIHDPTGGRRFIPIEVDKIDLQWLRENRDQVFAEAVELYKAGRKWWIYPHEETLARQQARAPEDPWLPVVREYLCGRHEIEPAELLTYAIKIPVERQRLAELTRVGILLRKLQCTPQKRRRVDGRRCRLWSVPPELASQRCLSFGPVAFAPVVDDDPNRDLVS
jgi:hypothetical protein